MGANYTTVEAVADALDYGESVRNTRRILAAIDTGSRAVDTICNRLRGGFWPEVRTRRFDWPAPAWPDPVRLWVGEPELVALTSVTSGGTTIDAGSLILYPDAGPPYDAIEIDRSTTASFGLGATAQNDIAVAGVWAGAPVETAAAGALASSPSSSSTTITVTDGSAVGVGDLITIDSERLAVTAKGFVDTTQNLAGDGLTESTADVLVDVADGTAFRVGEVLLVDAERVRVQDIAGNRLVVDRAVAGTVLAAHSVGADVFAARVLTVTRGMYGTTAAAHTSSTAISRHVWPALVAELALAEAVLFLAGGSAAYASTAGTGDHAQDVTGAGIESLRARCSAAHGRRTRHLAV